MSHSLPIIRGVAGLRSAVAEARQDGRRVALVPTMGALHDGHLSLCNIAAERAPFVVVSIFVNPTQFAAHEDLATYPRDEASDVARLAASGTTQLVYAPTAAEMYPGAFTTSVVPKGAAEGLETDFRPHFFAGVATVVTKLFTQVAPDLAVFGEKDYQQLQVIKQLVRDLDLTIEILPGPTMREADGLALSSRNAYLDARARKIAGSLNVIMRETSVAVARGADINGALAKGRTALSKAGFNSIDYLEIRDATTLGPVKDPALPMRILAAVRIANTRLIDNMAV
jgi:pantoate--beta-alanine ligase